jgi:hypothetical protein
MLNKPRHSAARATAFLTDELWRPSAPLILASARTHAHQEKRRLIQAAFS